MSELSEIANTISLMEQDIEIKVNKMYEETEEKIKEFYEKNKWEPPNTWAGIVAAPFMIKDCYRIQEWRNKIGIALFILRERAAKVADKAVLDNICGHPDIDTSPEAIAKEIRKLPLYEDTK